MAKKETTPKAPTPNETYREEDSTVKGAPETAQPTTDSTGPGVGRGPEPQKDE